MINSGDLDNQPQKQIDGRVRLTDRRGGSIFDGRRIVNVGPPIGDWTEWMGIRVALKRVRSDVFDGIVPDDPDDHPERLRSRQSKP